MNDIVRHQLGRAAASGAARFAPPLRLSPLLNRVLDSLTKVYLDKDLTFAVDCAPDLVWRIDEGDAFEIFGNVLDNAAKWARKTVSVRVWQDTEHLRLCITDDGPGFGDLQAGLQMCIRDRSSSDWYDERNARKKADMLMAVLSMRPPSDKATKII